MIDVADRCWGQNSVPEGSILESLRKVFGIVIHMTFGHPGYEMVTLQKPQKVASTNHGLLRITLAHAGAAGDKIPSE